MPPQIENQFNTPDTEPKQKFPKWMKYVFGILIIAVIAFSIWVIFFMPLEKFPIPCGYGCLGSTGPSATTTDQFSDWKIYRNEEYGFEFKYPNDLLYKEFPDVLFNKIKRLKINFGDQIDTQKISLSINDIFGLEGCNKESLKETKIIGNLNMLREDACGQILYNFKESGNDFWFINWNYDNKKFDQILSTFKFISTSTINTNNSGIRGKVTIGPTCPVERIPPDPNCADKAYKTKLRIVKDDTDYVVFTESDADGNFLVNLDPGKYIITIPDLTKQIPSMPNTNVIVEEGKYVDINLQFDSGIR